MCLMVLSLRIHKARQARMGFDGWRQLGQRPHLDRFRIQVEDETDQNIVTLFEAAALPASHGG